MIGDPYKLKYFFRDSTTLAMILSFYLIPTYRTDLFQRKIAIGLNHNANLDSTLIPLILKLLLI